jgi:hypothetical protein
MKTAPVTWDKVIAAARATHTTVNVLSVEGASAAIAHRAHRVHVVGGVHRNEQLAGRRWRLPDFVAEPSALGERRFDGSDACRPLGMPCGRLVFQASGMREIQRTFHQVELGVAATGATTTSGVALLQPATTRSLIAHATLQREPTVPVRVSGMPACQRSGISRFVCGSDCAVNAAGAQLSWRTGPGDGLGSSRRRSSRWRASPGLDAFDGATVLDSQSRVEHDAASCHAPDGVEVGLDDLWELPE